MRKLLGLALVAIILGGHSQEAEAFGLERWTAGERYHYNMARTAARHAGFAGPAAHLLGWTDDALDMYINHPLWDVHDFMKGKGHWWAAHSDNLFTTREVVNQWERYVYGTFYGLLWAAETNDPLAAFTILGTTCHALEDFYSHSTWVNDHRRRNKIPFDYPEGYLRSLPNHGRNPRSLWTGATGSLRPPLGKSRHGADSLRNKLRAGVASIDCDQDQGINLDRSCSAKVAAKNRVTNDAADWRTLFKAARLAAGRTDRVLLRRIGAALQQSGRGAFWKKVQNYRPTKKDLVCGEQWSDCHFDKDSRRGLQAAPWGFVTGGTYGSGEVWHLRVQIKTSDGTDSKVFIMPGAGQMKRLDRGGKTYNDFEQGDDDAYYVGPFRKFDRVKLRMEREGLFADWTIERIRIHAYYIGDREGPAYGLILDERKVKIEKDSPTWRVKLPSPMKIDFSAFSG